jgi:hypothetical protein
MSTYKLGRKKPCAQCPFTERGTPGWLGPYDTVKDLHVAGLHEAGYPCHVSQGEARLEGRDWNDAHQCVGALMYASLTFKNFKNPVLEQERLELKKDLDPKVLRGMQALKNYHESLPCMECGEPKGWLNMFGEPVCEKCRG